jgi:hypothetical protein
VRRKFTFYAHGSDIGDVAREAGRLDAVVVGRRSGTPEPILLDEADLTPGSHVLIAPKALIATLTPHGPSAQGEWFLNEIGDPVIEWIISRVRGDVLHSGRLYFLPQDVNDERDQFVDKPEQVRVLADGLFLWARRWARSAGGRSCGPEAARAVLEGRLQLAAPT